MFPQRLYDRLEINGDCLLWRGATGGNAVRYGVVHLDGKLRTIHRWVCEQAHGAPSDGQVATHSCDNGLCCNPAHLSWGTGSSNMIEARDRGRMPGKQKLTRAQAEFIKYQAEGTNVAVAREFGVAPNTVSQIRNGQSWKDI